ncbi:MAG: GNAT family N-acetyltransferase [Pseudomonadota bacterium]
MTTVTIPELRTDRLILRAPAMADFDAYAAMMASDRAAYMGQLSRRHAWYSFTNDVATWLLHGWGIWSVDLRQGTHIGQVGAQLPDPFPEPELGWFLHPGHEGHGFATEAALVALGWLRGRMDSLVSYIDPANARSIALAGRLGAVRDKDAPLPEGETSAETHVFRHWGVAP